MERADAEERETNKLLDMPGWHTQSLCGSRQTLNKRAPRGRPLPALCWNSVSQGTAALRLLLPGHLAARLTREPREAETVHWRRKPSAAL